MMNPQVAKLRARAEHLLDLFIALREKFALLEPLAFDADLAARVGTGPQARGHTILRNTLLESCVLDIVKLTVDADPRTPSVANLMTALEDQELRRRLRADHTVVAPITLAGGGSLSSDLLAKIQAEEAHRLGDLFDRCWTTLAGQWPALRDSPRLESFWTWRDKLIAHSELHHTDGKYHLLDLSKEGLKWSDLGELIAQLQAVIDSLQCVTRSASFAWDMLRDQLREASVGFWGLVGQDPSAARGAV